MFKISKLADYATLIMSVLANEPTIEKNTPLIAQRSELTLPTTRKVIRKLLQHQLVESTQGTEGGYRLARPLDQISLAEIVTAIDGPPALTECSSTSSSCQVEANCSQRSNWQTINAVIYQFLDRITLADLLTPLSPACLANQAKPLIFHQPKAIQTNIPSSRPQQDISA